MSVILASRSPRRRQLLAELGVDFSVVPSGVQEREPELGEKGYVYALALARDKAAAVARAHPDATVLAADTVVFRGHRLLGTPIDRAEAAEMLRFLRGRWHRVTTAVVVVCDGQRHEGHVTTEMLMKAYSEEEIGEYVATGESMDKAGAYAVQGGGGNLVEKVEGCYNNVVGLPLCLTRRLLGECGINAHLDRVALGEDHVLGR